MKLGRAFVGAAFAVLATTATGNPAHAAHNRATHASTAARGHHAAAGHVVAGHHAAVGHIVASGRGGKGRGHAAVRAVAIRGRAGRHVHGAIVEHHFVERFSASSFAATDLTAGDVTGGEDPTVRAAAVQALGNLNGTVLAIDPSSGRILAMVNQKLALSSGAEPCSTIKVSVALAALSEGIIKADTPVNLGGHYSLDLTHALAKSVNLYFEVLGRSMGFERVKHYANEFGLGELAGYNIPGEQLGTYPQIELPLSMGGVGRMCSFGESISMTPLQLGAMVGAIANGGTLYYLQHPTSPEQVTAFEPKVKRLLDIKNAIPEILPGMQGAVDFSNGTARSLRQNFIQFPVFGKTGTCSNNGTRFGWFASYGDAPTGRIVTVIFLEGGREVFGPKAAELTGEFYKAMYERNFFAPKGTAPSQLPAGVPEPKSGTAVTTNDDK